MAVDKEQLQALLADYVEGSLSERQIDEAEAYLEANPSVRTVVDRLMIDSEALRALPRQRASVDFSEDFRGQAERDLLLGDATPSRRVERSLGGPMLALAAMLVVGLGLGGAGYYVLAYRPASNLDFANLAGERTPPADVTVATMPAVGGSRAVGATEPVAAVESHEDDGKAWDRVFSPAVRGATPPPMSAPMTVGAPAPMMKATAAVAERALPDEFRASINARPSANAALVIVVEDAAAIDATRQVVNATLSQYAAAGNATSNSATNAFPGGVASVELPTTVPSGEVTQNVPAAAAERLRAAMGETPGVSVYDVAPTPPDVDAIASMTADASPMQRQQMSGGLSRERTAATQVNAPIDVYVVTRSATTTRPSDAP